MNQTVQLKRKKRRNNRILNITANLDSDESESTVKEIRRRLLIVFRSHVGKDRAINSYDLFFSVYRVNPESIDVYRRGYLWIVLRRILKEMRRDNTLFVITEKSRFYVLQTQEEANKLKSGIDKHIENLKGIKSLADKWVQEEKWKKI